MTTEFTPDEEALMSRPDSDKGILQRGILRLLRVHERDGTLPTSNRFLFYELVQARGGAEGGHRGSPGRPEPAQTEFLYSIPFCTAGTASAKSMTGLIWNS